MNVDLIIRARLDFSLPSTWTNSCWMVPGVMQVIVGVSINETIRGLVSFPHDPTLRIVVELLRQAGTKLHLQKLSNPYHSVS